jgi:C1A family cysteine protease
MEEKDLKAIQTAIKEKKYTWQAGMTSVSMMSPAEQDMLLGLVVEKAELDAMKEAITAAEKATEKLRMALRAPIAAPAAVDWRNKGGDWTTPIKNQGQCGSCVAFGTVATLEARINIACNNANLDKDLSEAHVFYCGCGTCCNNGWNFPPALDFCKNTGVAEESAFPYTDHDQPCKTGLTSFVKIDGWQAVLSTSDRKNVLATKGPVVGGMAVYSDFFAYTSGVYRRTSNNLRGYHAISVVGYDDNQQCWICKNSWGTTWGASGWFMIGYGECQMDTSFAFYDIDVKCPTPVDICDRYRKQALRYLALYRQTHNTRYLCLYYRYAAVYFACKYRAIKERKYLCQYYRYMSMYYLCMYRATNNKQYLIYYKRYYEAYKKCLG